MVEAQEEWWTEVRRMAWAHGSFLVSCWGGRKGVEPRGGRRRRCHGEVGSAGGCNMGFGGRRRR